MCQLVYLVNSIMSTGAEKEKKSCVKNKERQFQQMKVKVMMLLQQYFLLKKCTRLKKTRLVQVKQLERSKTI